MDGAQLPPSRCQCRHPLPAAPQTAVAAAAAAANAGGGFGCGRPSFIPAQHASLNGAQPNIMQTNAVDPIVSTSVVTVAISGCASMQRHVL